MNRREELHEQGRGMAGALIVLGISFAYTNEAWRLAIQLPAIELVGMVVVGLAFVVPIVRSVGFRSVEVEEDANSGDRSENPDNESEDPDDSASAGDTDSSAGPDAEAEGRRSPLWVVVGELLFQSLVVGYVTLFLLDVVTIGQSWSTIVRGGLVFVVPLAFGAALANELLSGEQTQLSEAEFPRSLGVFALGAIFFTAPIAPTEEVVLVAIRVGWAKIGGLVLFSLVSTFLMLHVLEFRGQNERLKDRSLPRQVSQTCLVYLVAMVVAVVLLLVLGPVEMETFSAGVRRSVVLAFPSTIGASAARVVLS
jgi:uncharacterized membrane protein